MENKKDFPKVVIWGMVIVGCVLVGFPLLCYFTFQSKMGEVRHFNFNKKIDHPFKS
jgi:hypothetical protein